MESVKRASIDFVGTDNVKSVLNYVLTANLYDDNTVYGFVIEMITDGTADDKTVTDNVTDSLETAEYIFDLLVKSAVTPVSLDYIIDDFISEAL